MRMGRFSSRQIRFVFFLMLQVIHKIHIFMCISFSLSLSSLSLYAHTHPHIYVYIIYDIVIETHTSSNHLIAETFVERLYASLS
jgi:hypothetical protein